MSFIISRGYAEVQILKTSESDPLSFWNILKCIGPNSESEKDICKKINKIADTLRYHIFVCNIGSAILHFCMKHKHGQKYLILVCNKCSNITHFLYYKNF